MTHLANFSYSRCCFLLATLVPTSRTEVRREDTVYARKVALRMLIRPYKLRIPNKSLVGKSKYSHPLLFIFAHLSLQSINGNGSGWHWNSHFPRISGFSTRECQFRQNIGESKHIKRPTQVPRSHGTFPKVSPSTLATPPPSP